MRKTITYFVVNGAFTAIMLLFIMGLPALGQPASARVTLENYSIPQKRLLVVSTAQFINFLTQSSLDQDSVMSIACRITGLPFLLPYNENFGNNVALAGTALVNAGKIPEAIQLLNSQQGEKRIQLLLELGIWYLHQPGTNKADMAHANEYAQTALILSIAGNYPNWQNACTDLLGECYYQSGDTAACKRTFLQMVSSAQLKGNMEIVAGAWQHLGKLLPFSDPAKLIYLNRSLQLYHKLKKKEKEIELLWNIAGCNLNFEPVSMEKVMRQILALQQVDGFKHSLYAQSMLSYELLLQGKVLDGKAYANAALQNMQWSGITAVAANFYMRVGNFYSEMENYKEALVWYKKGLENRSTETKIFWFKNFINALYCLRALNKFDEELALINNVTGEFPPTNVFEKLQIYIQKGNAYEKLKYTDLADKNYNTVLSLSRDNPGYSFNFLQAFVDIAEFYLSLGKVAKARLFMDQVLASQRSDLYTLYYKYTLRYKIDSAEKNYESAFRNHLQYKIYFDSLINENDRSKMEALTIKYGAEKKDQDIKLLKQQKATQEAELKQNKLIRNIIIGGAALLFIIAVLLFNQFRLKQRTNKAINKKNLALQHLLDEKEWLLKEVHHRVKNNLHTVICLLESQAAYLENDALKAIENSQHRIYAMSLIHQKLYQSDDIKTIDTSKFLPEFIRYLNESLGTRRTIRFELDIEHLMLGVSQAIPIVLIVNEAVTNSIKYAFPSARNGIIMISMHQVAGLITLIIADNGIGIDPKIIHTQSESLGLKLMNGLSEDINANMHIENNEGTKITIVFKTDPLNDNNNFFTQIKEKETYF